MTLAEKMANLGGQDRLERVDGSVGAAPEYVPGANVSTGPWPDQSDEKGLVERAARADAEAFRILVERHVSSIAALARRMLGDASEAEDVAQEVFLRLWRQRESLDIGQMGVKPWLRRVAVNLCLDRRRDTRRIVITDAPPEVAEQPTQERALDAQTIETRVRLALAQLPERQRQALTLFQYENMSQAEIAAALGATEEAVESLLSRARRALKQALSNDWKGLIDLPDDL